MNYRSGSQIREDFLRFFEGKVSPVTGQGHRRVHSSSLVPVNDPTLLFTNAGMNQFKDVFLGAERRDYSRATTSQKCVRAGGKHNDLENVGFTRRHHTFFEMLGNFSFGDYFKREAIAYAWELLTRVWGIDPSKLYITIFEGDAAVPRDDEAERFWIEVGVPKERIFGMSAKDNFWQMGETGPCGPCSEIYYDFGQASGDDPNVDKPFPHDDARYVEIWNLVFMQFDRSVDASGTATLTPLPKPSIDTGMGLERIACVLQNVLSNFDTDLFLPLIQRAAELTGQPIPTPKACHSDPEPQANGEEPPHSARTGTPAQGATDDRTQASLRIIADHARCATFLIADGVLPSNEGRGYVLRKIMRRGIRHGRLLGQEKPFLHEMVYAVRDEMANAYPELKDSADRVAKVVLAEEQQFARVVESGLRELEKACVTLVANEIEKRFGTLEAFREHLLLKLSKAVALGQRGNLEITIGAVEQLIKGYLDHVNAISFLVPALRVDPAPVRFDGHWAFKIYETFGLPLDFIEETLRDLRISLDMPGFEAARAEEQARARASWKGGSQKSAAPVYRDLPKTTFEGYSALRLDGAKVLALVKDGLGVNQLARGESGEVVLDATSFYADSGGQVGDIGTLQSHNQVLADVSGASKPVGGVWAHRVVARERISVGDTVDTVVDAENRAATTRNHTGTHLLHAALREVLGRHVKQAGSLVDRTRLRFDFSHFSGVAEEELAQIEDIVNKEVLADTKVDTFVDVPIDQAINEFHATALFGEKYGDRVRVVKIGDFSTELCGGTHTRATGEIGLVKLTGESSVSSGVRRVEALSGTGALSLFRRDFEVARTVGQLVGGSSDTSPAEALRARLAQQEEEMKRLRRELDAARMKQASAAAGKSEAVEVEGIKLLVQRVDGLERGPMRDLVDQLRGKLGSGMVVLGSAADGKVALIVGVTKDLTGKVQAGKVVGQLAALVGGKGGGRPDLAEAGGSDPGSLDAALGKAPEIVSALLA